MKTQILEIENLETPYYGGLDSEGNFISEAIIHYNDYIIECEVSWWYNFQIDAGDYYTPEYRFATFDNVTIICDTWYDLDDNEVELTDSTKAVILDKIEKYIKEEKTNFEI